MQFISHVNAPACLCVCVFRHFQTCSPIAASLCHLNVPLFSASCVTGWSMPAAANQTLKCCFCCILLFKESRSAMCYWNDAALD